MIRRCSIILLVLGGFYPAAVVADNPSKRTLLKKYVEAAGNKSTPPSLTGELKTGTIGILPAIFEWPGYHGVRRMPVSLHVVQIQNKTSMLVVFYRPVDERPPPLRASRKGAPEPYQPRGTPPDAIYLWVEGVPTESLSDDDNVDNLNPLVYGKIFYVGTKTYTTGAGQRTVKKLTVVDIQDDIDAYRKDLEAAKHKAKKRYDRALSKLKKKYKKELRSAEQKVKEKHLGEN